MTAPLPLADVELRLECARIACAHADRYGDQPVELAERLLAFVTGEPSGVETGIREIIREEIIDFTVMRSGLAWDSDDRQRDAIRKDWDQFRTSASPQGKSDA